MADDIKRPKIPADFFFLVKRVVGLAEDDDRVSLPAGWIRTLLALAERAPQSRRRPSLSIVQKRLEAHVLRKARRRKAELMAQGMKAEPAAEQAAKEASAKLGKTRNVSVETIKDRMRRKRKR
jgi:hypothetical protein